MRLPILSYHAVLPIAADAEVRGTVPLTRLRDQLRWLARRGFTTLTLDAALDVLAGTIPGPRRPIVITFDDGYRCIIEHALAAFEEFGFSATWFIVTDRVGDRSEWYVPKGGRAFEHADWGELELARDAGWEIASHGVTHQRLTELSPDAVVDELAASRASIVARMGQCGHFAYPHGQYDPQIRDAVRAAGYRSAVTTRSGFNRLDAPAFELRRQKVSRGTTLGRFRRRAGAWW